MTTIATHVRRVLQDAARPMRVAEIVGALDVPADVNHVRAVLGELVRSDVVLRHHSQEGLTYTLSAPAPRMRPTPAVMTGTTVTHTLPARPPRKGSVKARVLGLLSTRAMTAADLAEASRGCLSTDTVSNALQELRKTGWVVGDHRKPVTWTHIDAPRALLCGEAIEPASGAPVGAHLPRQVLCDLIANAQLKLDSVAELLARAKLALDAYDELPPCVGERMRDATHDIARNGAED